MFFGERKSLGEVPTWEWMISCGINIHSNNYVSLRNASFHGHLDVVKFLVENGSDIHYCFSYLNSYQDKDLLRQCDTIISIL